MERWGPHCLPIMEVRQSGAQCCESIFLALCVFVPDSTLTPQCRSCFSEKLKFLHAPPAADEFMAASSSGSSAESTLTNESFLSETQAGPTIIGAPTAAAGRAESVTSDPVPSCSDDDRPVKKSRD